MDDVEYPGACHCGALGFRYATPKPLSDWSIRACQCHFCRMHDALTTSDPEGSLCFTAAEPARLNRYRFALGTADFLLCRGCGVYLGAVIEVGSERYGIINTRALQNAPRSMPGHSPISYDGEDERGRIGRRRARWTPVTAVPW